jgi:two-component system, chemotaxis family, protein-glutamate methylesterase/glutaminase
MKTWIGLIISDETLKNTVQTLLKVTNELQVVGIYSDAREAAADLKKKGDVQIIVGLRGDQRSMADLKVLQLSGPYPVLGVGGLVEVTPILFDAFRLGMVDFIPFSPEDIGSPTDSLLRRINESIRMLSLVDITRIARARIRPVGEGEKTLYNEQAGYYAVVGVPYGGINGAIKLLSQLPRRRDTAILVSLPLPRTCFGPFIAAMSPFTQWPVKAAAEDERVYGGTCYFFSSFDPYSVEGSLAGECRVVVSHENVGPIDSIMEGLAGSFGGAVLGVLMEGVGTDGIYGLSTIRSRGGTTLTIKSGGGILTEASSGASERKVGDFLVDIDDLPKTLATFMGEMEDITNINRLLANQ